MKKFIKKQKKVQTMTFKKDVKGYLKEMKVKTQKFMEIRAKATLAVYLIVQEKEKTLLSLRKNTGYCDGMYSLIAGHVQEKETATQAIIREAKEEADMDIEPSDLEGFSTMYRMTDSLRVDFFLS